jgi:hypothetical protein
VENRCDNTAHVTDGELAGVGGVGGGSEEQEGGGGGGVTIYLRESGDKLMVAMASAILKKDCKSSTPSTVRTDSLRFSMA